MVERVHLILFPGCFWTVRTQTYSKELRGDTPLEGHLGRGLLTLPGPGFVHFLVAAKTTMISPQTTSLDWPPPPTLGKTRSVT